MTGWAEPDSAAFLELGPYVVPERGTQTAVVCDLIPEPSGSGLVVDVGCGEGLLAVAILDRFPSVRVLGLDGSRLMLDRAAERARRHEERFEGRLFDLAARSWRRFAEAPQAIVSSLAVHHLDGAGKRELFADLAAALRPGGVLVIADLVAATTERGVRLAARMWDEAVRERALELDGDDAAFRRFRELDWNHYAARQPDPGDRPSSLLDQLLWLEEAGFEGVDVFWMRAGHAIFGGVRPRR